MKDANYALLSQALDAMATLYAEQRRMSRWFSRSWMRSPLKNFQMSNNDYEPS